MSASTPTPDVEDESVVVHYFIDEAGDPVLFGKRNVIVGTQSSRYFLLGKLEVGDPVALAQALDDLRKQLLADPVLQLGPVDETGGRQNRGLISREGRSGGSP